MNKLETPGLYLLKSRITGPEWVSVIVSKDIANKLFINFLSQRKEDLIVFCEKNKDAEWKKL